MATPTSADVNRALLLTFIGAAGTALGGLLVIMQNGLNWQRLGIMQVSFPFNMYCRMSLSFHGCKRLFLSAVIWGLSCALLWN